MQKVLFIILKIRKILMANIRGITKKINYEIKYNYQVVLQAFKTTRENAQDRKQVKYSKAVYIAC